MNTSSFELRDNARTIKDFVAAVAEATGASVHILSTGGEMIAASGGNDHAPQTQEGSTSDDFFVDINHEGALLGRLVVRGGQAGLSLDAVRPFAVAAGFLLAHASTPGAEVGHQERESVARVSREAEELISRRDFLEEIIENYPGILCVMDPPPDFRLVLANSRFTSMLAEPYASGAPAQ